MASIGKRHRELDEQGEGLCSVPMWQMGVPAGFCNRPAYGNPTPSGRWRNAYTGELVRNDGRYNGYVPALACPLHGGPRVRTFKDGDKWCAVKPDFVNLQESEAGFGDTREEAISRLGVEP